MLEMDESPRSTATNNPGSNKKSATNYDQCLGIDVDNNDTDSHGITSKKTAMSNQLQPRSNSSNSHQSASAVHNGYSEKRRSSNSPFRERPAFDQQNSTVKPHKPQQSPSPTIKTKEEAVTTNIDVNTAASEIGLDIHREQISGSADNQDDSEEQLSPNASLRRSSRVSALNAKKKLHQQIVTGSSGKDKEQQQQSTGVTTTVSPSQPVQQKELASPKTAEIKAEPQQDTALTIETENIVKSTTEMVQERSPTEVAMSSAPLPHEENPQQRVSAIKLKLKRKLDDGMTLDQYDCKFGIKLDDNGDVVMMSDGSEISSLNEEDVTALKGRYENTQKQEVSEEVNMQRELQICELEAILRVEEAKLLMMRKLRQNQQQHAIKKQQQEGIRRLAPGPGVGQNSSGQAYKPKVAVANQQAIQQQQNAAAATKLNGTSTHHSGGGKKAKQSAQDSAAIGLQSIAGAAGPGGIQLSTLPPQHLQVIQQLYERLSQNPQQMANLIKTLPAPTGQALTELLRQYAMAQAQANAGGMATATQSHQQQPTAQATTKSASQQSTVSATQGLTQAQIDAANKQARELTQQNITKNRQQLRRDLDQLITKLPVQKAPPPDLMFIPNGNQPEFAYLLGLDLTVQRVLKDKQMFRKPDFHPYKCEECETDFTPSWKAICGGENEDYHLYCERCVRQAQKRKVSQDNKTLLGRVFQQIKEREKEFERQVSAGKFNIEPVMPTPPPAPIVPPATKVLQQQNNVSASPASAMELKGPAAAALQQLSQQQQNASAAALNLSKSATNTGAGHATNATAMVNAAIKNAVSGAHQQKSANNSTNAARRSTNVNTSTPSATNTNSNAATNVSAANPLAALFQQNPVMQQQLAAMAALSNSPVLRQLGQMASNPMMLAAMTQNPMLLQQLFQAAMTAHQSQQHQQQQQQHQQQQHQQQQRSQSHQTAATTSSTNSTGANSSGFPAGAAAALAQLAQKSTQMQQQQTQQQQHQNQRSRPSKGATSHSSHHQPTPTVSNTTSTTAAASSTTSSSNANQQQATMAAMAAMMNSAAAANPMLQLAQLGTQNPQMLRQISSHPQFQQIMQMYMQQMKTAGGKK